MAWNATGRSTTPRLWVADFGPFPLGRPARIAVLASGRGTNLQALLEAFPGQIALVVSDRAEAPALERARAAGAATLYLPWSKRSAFEGLLQPALAEYQIDLIALAGFMHILSPTFTGSWQGRVINIHPSLLPSFPGLWPQKQALEAKALISGCTVHFVDAGMDTGPVILQRRVLVFPWDDEASLAARILPQEHRAYPDALKWVLAGWALPIWTPTEVMERYGALAAEIYAGINGATPEGAPRKMQYLALASLAEAHGVPVLSVWQGENDPEVKKIWLEESSRLGAYRPGSAELTLELHKLSL